MLYQALTGQPPNNAPQFAAAAPVDQPNDLDLDSPDTKRSRVNVTTDADADYDDYDLESDETIPDAESNNARLPQ